MTSRFTELIVDSRNPRRLAEFWCAVLGYRITDEDEEDQAVEIAGWDTGDRERHRRGPHAPSIVFVPVPEPKTVKVRIHIDVSPVDCTQDEEVARLLALGASHADVGQGEQSWVVLADPEGNEFCVLGSIAD